MQEIEHYYRESYPKKVKLISRILRGDMTLAEDVVQEAFARAIRFKKSFNPSRGTLDKWFNSILFNSLHSIQSENKGIIHVSTDRLTPQDVLEEDQLSSRPDLDNYISSCIKQVTNSSHRRILELFFLMGYTSKEISQIEYKISQTNVTTIVMRFRDKLKERK